MELITMGMRRHLRVVGSKVDEMRTKAPLRIAFATSDLKHVNQHFGTARCFAIYAVNAEQAELIEAAQFSAHQQEHDENKLTVKLDVLHHCAAVYCQAVGSSAIHKLRAAGIQPLKVDTHTPITRLIGDLQSQLRFSAPTWWKKAMAGAQEHDRTRFDRMEAEGWDE
jgi:nitrogen fixation protein NifX